MAVGHTRNDQAETVLLRLVRGAGPVGLAAIYPRAGQVIRPLLDARRTDVEAWLRERGLTWREDESNQDRTIPRNKVRHELLPWLVEAFGAGVVDVLARQAALSRDDAEWFELVATETADRLVIEDGTTVTLEQGALGALHPAIGRRVVLARCAHGGRAQGRRRRFVGFDHVEAVLALGQAGSGAIDAAGPAGGVPARPAAVRAAGAGSGPRRAAGADGRRRTGPAEPRIRG